MFSVGPRFSPRFSFPLWLLFSRFLPRCLSHFSLPFYNCVSVLPRFLSSHPLSPRLAFLPAAFCLASVGCSLIPVFSCFPRSFFLLYLSLRSSFSRPSLPLSCGGTSFAFFSYCRAHNHDASLLLLARHSVLAHLTLCCSLWLIYRLLPVWLRACLLLCAAFFSAALLSAPSLSLPFSPASSLGTSPFAFASVLFVSAVSRSRFFRSFFLHALWPFLHWPGVCFVPCCLFPRTMSLLVLVFPFPLSRLYFPATFFVVVWPLFRVTSSHVPLPPWSLYRSQSVNSLQSFSVPLAFHPSLLGRYLRCHLLLCALPPALLAAFPPEPAPLAVLSSSYALPRGVFCSLCSYSLIWLPSCVYSFTLGSDMLPVRRFAVSGVACLPSFDQSVVCVFGALGSGVVIRCRPFSRAVSTARLSCVRLLFSLGTILGLVSLPVARCSLLASSIVSVPDLLLRFPA